MNGASTGTDVTIASLAAAGGSYELIITQDNGTVQAGQHTNTATVSTTYNGNSVSDADDANYYALIPTVNLGIDVEKYVSVNGGTNFVDPDSAPGPLLLESGADPQFQFVVKNTSDVALSSITLTDSDFDLNGLIGDADTNVVGYQIATLAADNGLTGGDDEFVLTYTSASWAAGQHTDTATVNVTYQGFPLTDSDDADYFGAIARIDVEKYVQVGTDADAKPIWMDADDPDVAPMLPASGAAIRTTSSWSPTPATSS